MALSEYHWTAYFQLQLFSSNSNKISFSLKNFAQSQKCFKIFDKKSMKDSTMLILTNSFTNDVKIY